MADTHRPLGTRGDAAVGEPLTGAERTVLGRIGFETAAGAYERARPDYPDDAVAALVAALGIRRGSRVLDIAAGTGKLTRRLSALGATCLAVEPSASMRSVFNQILPEVPVVGATAEELPLASGSVDAVVVAQAFHWLDAPRALAEVARVLRPGGSVALIWNERDESDPVVAHLAEISLWGRFRPYAPGTDFGRLIEASGLFGPVDRTRFRFVQRVDRSGLVDQVASRSYVQVLDDGRRSALLDAVSRFADGLSEPIELPHGVALFTAAIRTAAGTDRA